MLNKEEVNTLKEEFIYKANHLRLLFEYSGQIDEKFLKVKLAFAAFVSILFVMIFEKIEKFGEIFSMIFAGIFSASYVSIKKRRKKFWYYFAILFLIFSLFSLHISYKTRGL